MERYEAYKDSGVEWIGEIPEEWNLWPLKQLSNNYKAGPFGSALITSALLPEGNWLVYTPEHVAEQQFVTTMNLFLPESRISEMNQFVIRVGDIVFPIVGSLGRAILISEDMPAGILNQRLAKFRIDEKLLYIDYFMWLFGRSEFYSPYIELEQRGSIIVNLTKAIVGEMPVPLPSLNEQRAIADYLDAKTGEIDALVADCEREVGLLQEYRKAVISEAVTKGLDPDAPMKDSGVEWIGEIPASWETNKLRYCGTTQNGISKGGEYFGSGYPFISYGNAYRNELDKPELFGLIESSEDERERYGIRRGDVLFTRTSETIEEVGIAAGALCNIADCCFAGFLIRFRPNGSWGVLPEYAAYYFRSDLYRPYLTKEMVLVTRASMSQQLLGGITILIPPASEQEDIVGYLDAKTAEIDSLINAKQSMADKLREYRKSLISEAVTGKFKVPGA